MPHPRFEELQTQMYPSAMLHQFGVNGKISGSVFAAGEIKDTLAVIHGPCGCGYHYRYSARRRHAPLYSLVASDLKEEDIVFGGEERLYQTLVRAAGTYSPALILVIPSPVSDIIQDDIAAVAGRVSEETGIPVIDAVSEVFSHRDRRYSAKRFKAVAGQKMDKAKPLDFDIRGCGYTEVLCALVDKLMMPQQVRPLTVNLETVAWGTRGKQELADIEKTLNNSGVRVNAFFPAATVEQIQKMPSAQLNIARRIRWARQMKEKFSTPYIGLNNTQRYSGLDGACLFYNDVDRELGLEGRLAAAAEQEMFRARKKAAAAKACMGKYRMLLATRDLQNMPYMIKRYTRDFGFCIPHALVQVPDQTKKNLGITPGVQNALEERVKEAVSVYSPGTRIYINPPPKAVKAMVRDCQGILGTADPVFAQLGLAVIHPDDSSFFLSFEAYSRSVKTIADKLDRNRRHPHLWLNQLEMSGSFPGLLNKKNILASRQVWTRRFFTREDG